MIKQRRLRCSFCRKNDSEVLKLVAGPRVYICDECVAIASRIMADDSYDDRSPGTPEPTVWRKLSARVRRLFDVGEVRRVSSFVGAALVAAPGGGYSILRNMSRAGQ